VRSLLALM